jgi:serine/threonine-protein kinase
VQVPAVEGKQVSDAITVLAHQGLKYHVQKVNSVEPSGTVVRQNPQPYSQPVPLGYHVTLKVSKGMVRLPDVTGLDYEDAITRLNSRHFTNVQAGTTIPTTDATKNNKVAKESPTPGKAYKPDQEVILDKYVYVPPLPTCSPTPPPPTGSLSTPPPTGTTSSPVAPTTGTPTGSPTCVPG